jgi:hypothetical protein
MTDQEGRQRDLGGQPKAQPRTERREHLPVQQGIAPER